VSDNESMKETLPMNTLHCAGHNVGGNMSTLASKTAFRAIIKKNNTGKTNNAPPMEVVAA
jgi:hypothetical protein